MLLRCFTSHGYLYPTYVLSREFTGFTGKGCPIRESPVELAGQQTEAFRSLATPFIDP